MKNKAAKSYPDRINLNSALSERVQAWQKQIESSFKGALKLGRSELVNFVLGEVQRELPQSLLLKVFNEHFDEIRFLTWAKSQILSAKRSGNSITLAELRAGLLSSISNEESAKVARKRIKKAMIESRADTSDLAPQSLDSNTAPQGAAQ